MVVGDGQDAAGPHAVRKAEIGVGEVGQSRAYEVEEALSSNRGDLRTRNTAQLGDLGTRRDYGLSPRGVNQGVQDTDQTPPQGLTRASEAAVLLDAWEKFPRYQVTERKSRRRRRGGGGSDPARLPCPPPGDFGGLRGRGPGWLAGQVWGPAGWAGLVEWGWQGRRGGIGGRRGLWAGQSVLGAGLQRRGAGGRGQRQHLVHEALGVEQRGPRDGVHLQRVASVGEQELRAG